MTDPDVVSFADAPAWEAWLSQHHASHAGVWLKIAKKGSGSSSVSYAEALDVALCYGWIDGQKRPFSDTHWLQRFTPRKPRSIWSQVNVDKVAVLTAAGRMQPSGLAAVEAAKSDGRWDAAYAGQRTMEVPDDFRVALDAVPEAAAFFDALPRGARYSFLFQVHGAKRPATRAARIERFVGMCARRERL